MSTKMEDLNKAQAVWEAKLRNGTPGEKVQARVMLREIVKDKHRLIAENMANGPGINQMTIYEYGE